MSALRIPQGWKLEPFDYLGLGVIVLYGTQAIGAVTIDFTRRGFRLGYGVVAGDWSSKRSGRHGQLPPPRYKGRDWKQRIVDDAIACLHRIYGETL